MRKQTAYDVIVVGAGPNGLAAAVRVAQTGRSVLVLEAGATPGGACRSGELTLPGFTHDLGSAVHPLGLGSPFFRTLPLAEHGLDWVQPDVPLAHPFDDGPAALLERSIADTALTLGADAEHYIRLMTGLVPDWEELCTALRQPLQMARYPFGLARFGLRAIQSARRLSDTYFRGSRARALFAGCAAHSFLALEQSPSAAFGLVLAITGHAVGWPIPRGGAQAVTNALVSYLHSLGGEVICDQPVTSLRSLPPARAIICDITPRQLLALAEDQLPAHYRRQMSAYRYGPAAFKLDYALDGPLPWKAPECARAGTVHLGATRTEIAVSERAIWQGEVSKTPYVLLSQPTLFDPTRAPEGKHTVWAYCHVPNGYTGDVTDAVEAQIERFAPGFRDLILARHVSTPAALEAWNANLVGGDINGGAMDWAQLFLRPVPRLLPWTTPVPGLYLCSASTPPGGGVHGMGGYYAAEIALRSL
jgi:phytoene dehydrogenase-like protein